MNANTTPTQPPQGAMAPAEALAVLDSWATREALLADGFDKACRISQVRDTLSALLARCEGLEAALREVLPYFEGEHHPDHPHVLRIREAIAATRTTGGDGT